MSESTNKQLTEKIAALEAIVEKQSKLIAQTGQRLMELQVRNIKNDMKETPAIDLSDYVNNEDIVQLVTELQSQLDFLEDRAMRRSYNSSLTLDTEKLAPMMNKDGDLPEFPTPLTLKQFKDLDKVELIRLGLYYEIILPDEQEIGHALEQDNSKDAILNISKTKNIEELSKNFDDEQVNEIYDELARYFGIKHRRNSDGW
ncbi:hypothetical protein G210_1286 [Candida maltosa Xu316]|uniref:Mrp8p n=1 Tax=Candida maltosa (strain Xu316) TaxID=1245528 RepID=M3JYX3_CANMX|nr:hypothetical protein G210_1286 [Candida maltosa Xu316]